MSGGKALHVVAGVVVRDGLVLVARRLPGGYHGGLWEFPGGKVEEGEDPRQALARELMEELGVGVSVGERLAMVEWRYPHRTILLDVYRCDIHSGVPVAIECAEVAWVAAEALSALPMPEADGPVVEIVSRIAKER